MNGLPRKEVKQMPAPRRSPIERESIRSGGGHLGRKDQLSAKEQKRRFKKATKKLRG